MPLALSVSPLAQLLKNLAVEVADSTNHTTLAELANQALADPDDAVGVSLEAVLASWMGAVPFVAITPGLADKTGGDTGRRDLQEIRFHLVHGILGPEGHTETLTGSTAISGSITLLDALESALFPKSRWAEPYNQSPYNTGDYTAMTSVRGVQVTDWSEPRQVPLPGLADLFIVQTLTARYWIEKGV